MMAEEKTSMTIKVTKNRPKTACTVPSWRSGDGMAVCRNVKASWNSQ